MRHCLTLFFILFTIISQAQTDRYILEAITNDFHLDEGIIELSRISSEVEGKDNLRITIKSTGDIDSDNKVVWVNARLILSAYKAIKSKGAFEFNNIECLDISHDEYQELSKRIWFSENQLKLVDAYINYAKITLNNIANKDTLELLNYFSKRSESSSPETIAPIMSGINGKISRLDSTSLYYFVIFKQGQNKENEIYNIGLKSKDGNHVLKFYFDPKCQGRQCILALKYN
jgi:hypothetical protein